MKETYIGILKLHLQEETGKKLICLHNTMHSMLITYYILLNVRKGKKKLKEKMYLIILSHNGKTSEGLPVEPPLGFILPHIPMKLMK